MTGPRSSTTSRPRKRCWNCRARKKSCDRAQPSCGTCLRKGEECLGYGLQLSWPSAANSRRAATSHQAHLLDGDYSNVDFINTLSNDIARFYGLKVAEKAFAGVNLRHSPYLWPRQPAVAKGLELVSMSAETFAPFLVSNEHGPVSRLVSCNSRDLYGLLVRMSLSNETAPSLATRHAIAALCFQHRGMDGVALSHQTLAMRSLQAALNDPLGPTEALQSLAASRLLNIFETVNVNASAQSWASFFCGTKELARVVQESIAFSDTECKWLLDWSYYCDIMYKFSIRHWRGPPAPGSLLTCPKLHQLKTSAIVVASPSRHHTVNYLGYCSSELLGVIGQMIDAVIDRDDVGRLASMQQATISRLENRLISLEPFRIDPQVDFPAAPHFVELGELFRCAGLVYLHRVLKGENRHSEPVSLLLGKAYRLLQDLEVCEAPWPLFIIGMEARTDDERRLVLSLLGASIKMRPLGNLVQVERMVKSAWVQEDLGGEPTLDALTAYTEAISGAHIPPPFI